MADQASAMLRETADKCRRTTTPIECPDLRKMLDDAACDLEAASSIIFHQIEARRSDADAAKAVIEGRYLVIRLPLDNLQKVMDGGYACSAYDLRWEVLDTDGFGKEIVSELNDEDEEGSTMIHKMFDKAINQAIEQGAQHVQEHPVQEF